MHFRGGLLFAHILRRVFSATLAIDQALVALLLYGQLFNGVLIYTHWNIVSTFVRGWIRNWIVVKVTFSKTVRGNEEWQIESVIKNTLTEWQFTSLLFEPGHSISYKNTCVPSKDSETQISLRICTVWSVFVWHSAGGQWSNVSSGRQRKL